MNEQGTNVLEQYDLEVSRTSRGRGAVLCETDRGLKLLKECRAGAERVVWEAACKEALAEAGLRVDRYVKNKDGTYLTRDEAEGLTYTLRDWFDGRECSTREEREMVEAVRVLARFHRAARAFASDAASCGELARPKPLLRVIEKHNRELKRARTYIRQTAQKTEFELCVIRSFALFYAQAQEAYIIMKKLDSGVGPAEYLCHGDFNQHHVLMDREGAALVEFSRLGPGVQVTDLYQYLRKMMEKNGWSLRLAERLLGAYEEVLPMTKAERRYLYILFLYPEKYWKQINYYFNTNKAWTPGRSTEKLTVLEEQFEAREIFLRWLERRLV